MNTDNPKYMDADDVQYLDWQWVEEHPVRALDLMLKLHSENAALRDDKETLDWMNNNIEAIMFKYKPDGFTWDVRGIIRGTMTKEAKS